MEQTFYVYKSSKGNIVVSFTKLSKSYKLIGTANSMEKANEIRRKAQEKS